MGAEKIEIRECSDGSQTKKNVATWQLEDHVCRKCFGRLISTEAEGGDRLYRCTNCGNEAVAKNAKAVCCCGMTINRPGKSRKTPVQVDAGVRCIPNPNRSAQFPSEIVASEVVKK